MPLDGFTQPTGAYSFRRLLSADRANRALSVVRASDSAIIDIGFAPNGNPDIATLAAFLTGTTGKVVTWYDQSGNGRDLTQATDANRPAIVLGALGVWPCMEFTTATMALLAAGNVTPATGLASFSVVGNRTVGTGAATLLRQNGNANRIGTSSVANTWRIVGGTSGSVAAAAADAAWHAAIGVMNGASSLINIDGTETTGTAAGSTAAGAPGCSGQASTTTRQIECVMWDNLMLSAAERAGLVNDPRRAWGF